MHVLVLKRSKLTYWIDIKYSVCWLMIPTRWPTIGYRDRKTGGSSLRELSDRKLSRTKTLVLIARAMAEMKALDVVMS